MNNKGQIGITTLIELLVVALVGVAVVLPTMIDIIDTAQTDIQTIGIGQEIQADLTTPVALSYDNIVPGTTDLGCPDVQMVEDTDYTMDNDAGEVTFIDDRTFNNYNFTSNLDENSSVYYGTTWMAYIGTAIVFNCTNQSQVWVEDTDYEIEASGFYITALGTGDMVNNTVYCGNFTGSVTYQDANCTIDYEFTQTEGTEGIIGTIFQILPIVFAVVLLVAIVGFIGFRP